MQPHSSLSKSREDCLYRDFAVHIKAACKSDIQGITLIKETMESTLLQMLSKLFLFFRRESLEDAI